MAKTRKQSDAPENTFDAPGWRQSGSLHAPRWPTKSAASVNLRFRQAIEERSRLTQCNDMVHCYEYRNAYLITNIMADQHDFETRLSELIWRTVKLRDYLS